MSTDRVVPEPNSGTVPIIRLDELHEHLRDVQADPSITLNAKLLDDVELQLTETNIPPLLPTLLEPLTQILKTTTQDPSPLLSLTIKLLSPLSFTRLLTIADPPSILSALSSPLPGANQLALAILHKAARSPSDAAILSTLPELVEELVRRWLDAADVGVGEKAAKVLGDVLEVDSAVVEEHHQATAVNGTSGSELVRRPPTPGHGRVWQLLFSTRHYVSLIYSLCSSSSADDDAGEDTARTERQITISQGRLLRLLPRLATLDIHALSRMQVEGVFTVSEGAADRGILQWASLDMVDKTDLLMHLNVIDFFETLVSVLRVSGRAADRDHVVKNLVQVAVRHDEDLRQALLTLPDRTVEEEAEALRQYIARMLA